MYFPFLLLLGELVDTKYTVYRMQSTKAPLTFQQTLNLGLKGRKIKVAT